MVDQKISENYFKNVVKGNGCWGWLRCKDDAGYGLIWWDKKPKRIHRFSWEYYKGKIPKNMCVLHKCDNPICSNPDHLFLGTHKDNSIDSMSKNRHANQIFKIEDIHKIRRWYLSGEYTQVQIAKIYKVRSHSIWRVCSGKAWAHLNLPPIKKGRKAGKSG